MELYTPQFYLGTFGGKEDYPWTRASDSKLLPALTHSIFFSKYTRFMLNICFIGQKVRFHHGFIWKKTLKC